MLTLEAAGLSSLNQQLATNFIAICLENEELSCICIKALNHEGFLSKVYINGIYTGIESIEDGCLGKQICPANGTIHVVLNLRQESDSNKFNGEVRK